MRTQEERDQIIARIMELPTDDQKLEAYAAFIAQERAHVADVVLMCQCADWQACAHPWPQRMTL